MGSTRNSKKDRGPLVGRTRQAIADNVLALCLVAWPTEKSKTARLKKLAEKMGAHLPQIQRITTAASGISVDELDRLADAFNVPPHDLATPYKFRKTVGELVYSSAPEGLLDPKQVRRSAVHDAP